MRNRTIRRFTRQLNHLLSCQRGLANDGFSPALLAQLAQDTGRLFFVGVNEHAFCIALLGFQHSG